MNKKSLISLISTIVFLILLTIFINVVIPAITTTEIPDNYDYLFMGGSGEITYTTYVYKKDNKYKFINTTNTTKSWGSSEWDIKITKKGSKSTLKEILKVAKQNSAYSSVKTNEMSVMLPIEEAKEAGYLK